MQPTKLYLQSFRQNKKLSCYSQDGFRRDQKGLDVILAPPFVCTVTHSGLLNFSEPQFPYLLNGDAIIYFLGSLYD